MKKIKFNILFILLIFLALQSSAQKPFKKDKGLSKQMEQIISGFHGDVGIYVHNLKNGKGVAINADTLFPTASTIKVPIMCALFDKIIQKDLTYKQSLIYSQSQSYGGSGVMQYFKDSTKTTLDIAATLMITYSDNTAALWCQKLAGGGLTINNWLADNNFTKTRVNSRTAGRQEIWEKYGWGQTTPREIATLVSDIKLGKILTPAACERMYRNMTNMYYDGVALSQIPPYVQTASKGGSVNSARSEVVLVNAPHGDYVFAVYTKHIKDQSWNRKNEAEELIRSVSATLWHYFEPRSKWKPAKHINRL